MDELTEQILAEKENVDIALHNLKTAMANCLQYPAAQQYSEVK